MNSLIIFETLGLVMLAQLYTSWDPALPDLKEWRGGGARGEFQIHIEAD